MWRRFERELEILAFLKQQIKLRQFLEKNAKKESFRSVILEASDISSSEEKKKTNQKIRQGRQNTVED